MITFALSGDLDMDEERPGNDAMSFQVDFDAVPARVADIVDLVDVAD